MGIPQFERDADPESPFPFFAFDPPSSVKKRFAGNVSHLRSYTVDSAVRVSVKIRVSRSTVTIAAKVIS